MTLSGSFTRPAAADSGFAQDASSKIPGHKFFNHQPGHRPATRADEQRLGGRGAEHRHTQAGATGARSGGVARIRLFRRDWRLVIGPARLFRVQLEGAAAIGADVIEAALRLT